jgi:hypothetical protein
MGHEKDALRFLHELVHFTDRFLLETHISHRERLVNNEDIGADIHGNRKRETYRHPARVRFHGLVNEIAKFRKINDALENRVDV